MLVTEYLDTNKPFELTPKEIAELDEAARHPVSYDEECPPMTEEQIHCALEYLKNKRNAPNACKTSA